MCSLFIDAVSNSYYIVLDEWVAVNNELKRTWRQLWHNL
jgi:hypothetical protein